MHLQSLELFGFKSFADKTIFSFHEGVTAIVGPNGCGKSNVLDAVRWVLGEQSAKSLRGGEMADVIFNGTDSRKPLGFAEVSLTFTDCAADLGVDWHEVRVTRRVHRDGISEYFLNKGACRLKDIHTLFADTGVGRTAYSIMEQGKIDLILSSRPEDRRSIFEEAAGITKYKTQKKEALRKLEATEANLLRINDIIKEVKRQIGSLQRQAGKARRYQALHADLQVLDTHFSHRKLQALQSELAACTSEIEEVSRSEGEIRAAIGTGENQLAQLRLELDHADADIAASRAELQGIENDIASSISRIEFNEQRKIELNELITRRMDEIAGTEPKLCQHNTEVESANTLLEQTERSLRSANDQLQHLVDLVTDNRSERQKAEQKLHDLQINLSKDELRLADTSKNLGDLRSRRDATAAEAVGLAKKIASAGALRDEWQEKVEDARGAAERDSGNVEQLLTRVREAEAALREKQTALVQLEKQLVTIDRTMAEKQSRKDVLRQLNEEGEGLPDGSQALLKSGQFRLEGAFAAQLNVENDFVGAVEAALGRNLHAVILRDEERAVEIITYLNEQKLGHAVVLLDRIIPAEPAASHSLPAGAIAWAIDKVTVAPVLIGAIQRLLHNVAVFRDLDSALRAARETPGLAVATLAGEFVSAGGVLFGGKGKAGADSLLRRKATIETLSAELEYQRQERKAVEEQRRLAETEVSLRASELEESHSRHRGSHAAQTASASKLAELEREQYSAERDFDILQADQAALERQISAADDQLGELERQRHNLEEAVVLQRAELTRLDHACKEARQRDEETGARVNELRIDVATLQQRHDALIAQREPMLARRNELSELLAARRSEIESYQLRLQRQQEETAAASRIIEAQSAERARREEEIAKLARERAELVQVINTGEATLRASRSRLSELQERRGACSVRQTQLELQSEHVAEHTVERYHVNLREFTPDPYAHEKVIRAQLKRIDRTAATDDDLQNWIDELTRQLDAMGPVNLEAVQEYDELEERYRFLETQNNDLTSSRRELLDVIARINVTTQKLFGETFTHVRSNFREIFTELFGGGRADLQLVDETDALNCGIEIIARPPGKQLQSISLLSGGERTMAAVALLFAIYMVRSSPFCILDELDAPLDESNINRFIRVLERFVAQSQFIIITHNKRTIAKADILYGVTMEERGVSKLVGMKMISPRPAETGNPVPVIPEQRTFSVAPAEERRSLAVSR